MPQHPIARNAILAVLKEKGPMCVAELAEELPQHAKSLSRCIRLAHEAKLVHISGWKRSIGTSGRWGAVYSFGEGEDVKEPRRLSRKNIRLRYVENHKEQIRARDQKRHTGQVNHWLLTLTASR